MLFLSRFVGPVVSCVAVLSSVAVYAQDAAYKFKVGENPMYEVTVKTEFPDSTRSIVGYLMYRPQSVNVGKGQSKLTYYWGVHWMRTTTAGRTEGSSGGMPAFVMKVPTENSTSTLTIDRLGQIVKNDVPVYEAQLEPALGPAWQLALQPLPEPGKPTWTERRKVTMFHNETYQPSGYGRKAETTRVETPSEETVTYTAAAAPQGGVLTVQRKYELASLEKVGDAPVNRIAGDGEYTFDVERGLIASFEQELSYDITQKNVSIKVPVTVNARLLTTDEVAALKAAEEEAKAKQEEATAKRKETEEKTEASATEVPDGMVKTALLGTSKGGSPFVSVSDDRSPVIGFRFQVSEWGGRKVFRTLEPIYEEPGEKEDGETVVVAREGYAVGGLTVNAGEFVSAMSITFMKKTETGLDPKVSYKSPQYGMPQNNPRKVLDGKGRYVFGIFGRKGLNVDTLGLVVDAPAANGGKP